jgi:uncharacterized protein (TIGR00369 family)
LTSQSRLDELATLFHTQAPLAKTFGLHLSFTDDHRAVVEMPYNPTLDHALGAVHGGVYMTLLDIATWFTSAAAHDDSVWVATSEISVHLLKPVIEKALRAEGRLIQTGKRQDIVEALLYDGDGQLVGHGVGTFVVLPHLSTRLD